jgi:eukaryotic-like serine/threonine-protein kinase
MKPTNCWEIMKCGREPGGKNVAEFGVCPAAKDSSFDGINTGKNGGRICWAVAGTFCGGEIQGTFAEKRTSCIGCNFYKPIIQGM